MCTCGVEIEPTNHFLLHCPLFQRARQSLLTNIKKIDESILKKHSELIIVMTYTNITKFVLIN